MNSLMLRAAEQDIPEIMTLINSAYRSDEGRSWTNESKIVQGLRIQRHQLQRMLEDNQFELWLLQETAPSRASQILGCIGIQYGAAGAEIGNFAVRPDRQNMGLGRQLLQFAEERIKSNCPMLQNIEMYVLNARTELIAYYERCGYKQTQFIEDYPLHLDVGVPLGPIHLIQMRKNAEDVF